MASTDFNFGFNAAPKVKKFGAGKQPAPKVSKFKKASKAKAASFKKGYGGS